MDPKPKNGLQKNKTAIIISSMDSLAIHLGKVISEYGMSVHISNVDFSEETKIQTTLEGKISDKKEDFVLIYIR